MRAVVGERLLCFGVHSRVFDLPNETDGLRNEKKTSILVRGSRPFFIFSHSKVDFLKITVGEHHDRQGMSWDTDCRTLSH